MRPSDECAVALTVGDANQPSKRAPDIDGEALKRRSEVPQRAPLALLMKVDALRAAEEQ